MSSWDELVPLLVEVLAGSYGWRTQPVDGQGMAISTGRTHFDGEPVTLFASVVGGVLTVTDEGETWRRVIESGWDSCNETLNMLWERVTRAYLVDCSRERSGRVLSVRVSSLADASTVARLADSVCAVSLLGLLTDYDFVNFHD